LSSTTMARLTIMRVWDTMILKLTEDHCQRSLITRSTRFIGLDQIVIAGLLFTKASTGRDWTWVCGLILTMATMTWPNIPLMTLLTVNGNPGTKLFLLIVSIAIKCIKWKLMDFFTKNPEMSYYLYIDV